MIAKAQQVKSGTDMLNTFNAVAARESGFASEFNTWLDAVVKSQCVKTPSDATTLMRAIMIHSTRFVSETVGCSDTVAEGLTSAAYIEDYGISEQILEQLGLRWDDEEKQLDQY